MKVLFLHNTLPKYRVKFFNSLAEKCKLTLLLTDFNKNQMIYSDEDRTKELSSYINVSFFSGIKNILKIIKTEDYKIIVIPPLDNLKSLYISTVIVIFKSYFNYSVVLFWEKWEAPIEKQPIIKRLKNFIQRCSTQYILRRVDNFIASGKKSKEYFLSNKIQEEKIHTAIDASDVEQSDKKIDIRKKFNINNNDKIILYYGRIIERKGLKYLLEAVRLLKRNDIFLLICGDGDELSIDKRIAKELNIDKCLFTGQINPDYRSEFFSQSDLFVLPSYFYKGIPEAWGLTVNEALQYNLPVIVTDAVGSGYDLINKYTGKIIPSENSQRLAYSIEDALNNLNKNIVKENKLIVNSETMSNEFAKVFKKIVE